MTANVDPKLLAEAIKWQEEKKRKAEKAARWQARAESALRFEGVASPTPQQLKVKIFYLKQEAAAKWRLRECRATIGEIVKQHGGGGK